MNASSALLLLIVLACPLMMLFMHRGHGGHDRHEPSASIDELRRRRDALDRELAARGASEPEHEPERDAAGGDRTLARR